MEPQLSFSVAALLGDKLLDQSARSKRKDEEDADSHPVLPPTPQPSDSEEDEPPRKRRCVEQCELAKVNKTDSLIDRLHFAISSSLPFAFPFCRIVLIDWDGEWTETLYDSIWVRSFHLFSLRVGIPSDDTFVKNVDCYIGPLSINGSWYCHERIRRMYSVLRHV